jgi:hypothetical protein
MQDMLVFENTKNFIKNWLQIIREVLYGMTIYDWVHELNKVRHERNRLFIMIVFGDLIGIPILPPYYTLRLIPYIVGDIQGLRRSILRERDLTDLFGQELG